MLFDIFKKKAKKTNDESIGKKAYTTQTIEWDGKEYPENTPVIITEVDNGPCGRGYGFQFPDGKRISEAGWFSVRFDEN